MLQAQLYLTDMVERGTKDSSGSSALEENEVESVLLTIDRGVSVSRMMMEAVDSVRDAQEYTTVVCGLAKALWNKITLVNSVLALTGGAMDWQQEQQSIEREALAVAKQAAKECRVGHCKDIPEIDQQNLAAATLLIEALEKSAKSAKSAKNTLE